tara:strand:- start:2078 stop:3220 length:1143 start_codon:yes stop_codon:yes gene_type:complete
VNIKQAIKNNQSINISLNEDLLIKDTLVFPYTYDKRVIIDGNGFSIRLQDPTKPALTFKNASEVNIFNTSLSNQIILDSLKCNLNLYNVNFIDPPKSRDWYISFINQQKGTLKCYGCYFESNKKNIISLNQRSLRDCHAIIGCHAKSTYSVESNFIGAHGYNNEICIISTHYETVLGTRNNLVYTEGINRGSIWVLGCVMESTVGNMIQSNSPNSNSVVYGSFKKAAITTISGPSYNKISFDIYNNISGHYQKSSTQEENNGIIMHNEPTYDEVAATPTIKHSDTLIDMLGCIDIKTKTTRYFSLATQEDVDEGSLNEVVTVFDQCNLRNVNQTTARHIFLNSYLEEYYKTNQTSLFVNPYDSGERKTRVRFANRKKGTW